MARLSGVLSLLFALCCVLPSLVSSSLPGIELLPSSNVVYGRVGTPSVSFLGAFDAVQDCAEACASGGGPTNCSSFTYHEPSFPDKAIARHCYGLVSYFDWYPTLQQDVVSGRLAWPCRDDADCSMNGKCGPDGECLCRDGWKGHSCTALNLAPVDPSKLGFRSVTDGGHNTSTWGGAVVASDDKSQWFMYASEIENHCGMSAWCQNSHIVMANASSATGPYTRVGEVFPTFSHEPSIARDPTTGKYAMFFTAQRPDTRQECTQCADGVTIVTPCPDNSQCNPNTDPTWMSIADTAAGPWSDPVVVLNGTGSDTNLSPVILSNGSLVGLYRTFAPTPTHNWFGSKLHLVTASKWDDPSTYVADSSRNVMPTLGSPTGFGGAEDPFLYVQDGVFHVVLHNMYGCGTGIGSRPCGTHGFSLDGWTWQLSGTGAYNRTIEMTDGGALEAGARERPHLILDSDTSAPIALVNGVVYDRDASFTVVQPIG